jgi:hypothetical protein
MLINELNLMLAGYTDSTGDYRAALDDFNYMNKNYGEYLLKGFDQERSYGSSLLAQEGVILAGLAKLDEAEDKFTQAFDTLLIESLSRLRIMKMF